MRDLVEFLARALVENPDAVEVTEVEENGDLVVEVTVGGDDLGRLIGKGGRVANAIRTVAKAASTGSDRRGGGASCLRLTLPPLSPPGWTAFFPPPPPQPGV